MTMAARRRRRAAGGQGVSEPLPREPAAVRLTRKTADSGQGVFEPLRRKSLEPHPRKMAPMPDPAAGVLRIPAVGVRRKPAACVRKFHLKPAAASPVLARKPAASLSAPSRNRLRKGGAEMPALRRRGPPLKPDSELSASGRKHRRRGLKKVETCIMGAGLGRCGTTNFAANCQKQSFKVSHEVRWILFYGVPEAAPARIWVPVDPGRFRTPGRVEGRGGGGHALWCQ